MTDERVDPVLKAEDAKSLASKGDPPQDSAASAAGAAMAAERAGSGRGVGNYRWVICSLLFFATTVNYMDRQVLGILEPMLQKEFGWTKQEYGWVNTAFQWSYGFGFLFAGRLIDKFGARLGFSVAVIFWSLAAMSHAFTRNVAQLAWARGLLGLGESANFPCAVKTVADWFPKQERALATGIFNAGSNVGLTITPLVVPWIAVAYGWRSAFLLTGAIGFLWLVFWLIFYRDVEKHPKVTREEVAYIRADGDENVKQVGWLKVLPKRQTWAFAFGKLATDPAWWFYLFWLGPILHDKFGLNIKEFGPPLFVIYVMADLGSIGGGWMSSRLIKEGWSVNASRKTAMLVCAVLVIPIAIAAKSDNLWLTVILIGLAAAAHQGWSANLFTLVSDTFPRRAIGTVVGIGGFAGALSGGLFQPLAGRLKDTTGNYELPLMIIAFTYVVTLLVIHLLVPKLEPVEIED